MAEAPSKAQARATIGVSIPDHHRFTLNADEFVPELRGANAIRKYREMRDNDAMVGAVCMAVEMLIRGADFRMEPAEVAGGDAVADFFDEVMADMDTTLDDFLASAVSFLPYGFSIFEVIYKIRGGPDASSPERRSMHSDGMWGIRSLAPRPQWTIDRFVYDGDEVSGVVQRGTGMGYVEIPREKYVHFRTTSANGDPAGRSILRNAYTAYHYATHIKMLEAIAIERELNGIPVGRIPSEYLGSDDPEKVQVVDRFKRMLEGAKANELAYFLLPSDPYYDDDGKPTNVRQMDIELMTANGSRAIPTGEPIQRYGREIAGSVLADFLTLGQSERGSFALSKSKTDLFLAAASGFTEMMAATIKKQIVLPLMRLNGMPFDLAPTPVFGDIAPADLAELGAFLRDAAGAGIPLGGPETERVVRATAGLPEGEVDEGALGESGDDDEGGANEDG